MKTIKVKRTIVAEILDKVRQDLAARVPHETIEERLAIGYVYNHPRLEPLQACPHDVYTDNCMACEPRWGWTGVKVVCS